MLEYFRVESIINERIEKENRKKKKREISLVFEDLNVSAIENCFWSLDRSSARKAGEEAQD